MKTTMINEEELRRKYPNAVLDGIIHPETYRKSPIKILWILKEVNDKDGGCWDLRAFLGNKDSLKTYSKWKSTIGLVIKVSYGILNDFPDFKEADNTRDERINVLRQIAVINVNKLPGDTRTNFKTLKYAFKEFEPYLINQINEINPQIIIGGNTLWLFRKIFNISDSEAEKLYPSLWAFEKDGRLWLDAYHPQQTKITHKDYYRQITNRVKGFIG
jgi:hypothetical protein